MEMAGLTAAIGQRGQQQQQQQPQRACPRCNSNNTKFCYFNNYSLTQPRYFCKGCRRYWTHGGTLRNVPVGGSSRKSKRPREPNSPGQPPVDANPNPNPAPIASSSNPAPPLIAPANLFPFQGGFRGGAGGGFLSSLIVGAPALQSRADFTSFGRQNFSGGWPRGFNISGGDGGVRPAVGGAQFWTMGGSAGSRAVAGAGEQGGCGSNPNQWRNFPAVAGGGENDN